MKDFWKPLQGEFKWNPNGILCLIGALGIIPAIFVVRYADSFWSSMVFFILWYAIVYLTFLTFLYFKDK